MIYKNHTNYLYIPDSDQRVQKRSVAFDKLIHENFANENLNNEIKLKYFNKRDVLNKKLFENKIILQTTNKIDLDELLRNNIINSIFQYKEVLLVSI
jgi:hypothetical protein